MAPFALNQLLRYLNEHASSQLVDMKREYTFGEVAAEVEATRQRLEALGVQAGMRVGFLAENRVEWIIYDIALIELGCTLVALPDQDELERYDLHLVVSDQPAEGRSWWLTLDEPGEVQIRDAPLRVDPETPAWVFSSGSTGRVKCIATRRSGVEALVTAIGTTFHVDEHDRFLIFLPMASFQQRFLIYACLWLGVGLKITKPQFLVPALRSFAPTIMLGPPALFAAVAARVDNLGGLKRLGLQVGLWLADHGFEGLRRKLSRDVVEFFGGKARLLLTGMAPSSPQTLRLFTRMGFPIHEVYGMTECGMIAWNTPERRREGSVGRPIPGVDVHLAADGEVLVSSSTLPSSGYLFDQDDAGRQTYVSPTTIATGDVGRFDDDGFLYLVGRKKNVIVTAGGLKLHPESLEKELCTQPDIQMAVVFDAAAAGCGEGLAAVVVPRRPDSPIRKQIEAYNRGKLEEYQIRRFAAFTEAFSRENGFLTGNMKLARGAIQARAADRLENL